MRNALRQALEGVGSVEEEALLCAEALLQRRRLQKDEYICRAGEVPTHLCLILSGWMREFYIMPDGTERTKGFALSGEFSGALPEHLRGGKARAFVVAGTECETALVSFRDYCELRRQWASWETIHQAIVERLLLTKVQREWELLTLNASARYEALLRERPNLESVVPQKHIASYLGISSVHLSRIRRQMGSARTGVPA